MRFTSALQLFILKVVIYSETVWSEDPGCPDCSKIRCESDLQEADCPDDTILAPNALFGCCTACVKYLEYGSPCPGLYTEEPGVENITMKWKEYSSTNGHGQVDVSTGKYDFERLYYPDKFISATVGLPCAKVNIPFDANLGGKTVLLPERVFSANWAISPRDDNKSVPVINSARCSQNLRCFLTYDELGSGDHVYPTCLGPVVHDPSDKPGQWVNYIEEDFNQLPCTYKTADYSAYVAAKDCSVSYWKPSCKHDLGTFDAVQQKSFDSHYFCSSPQGERLAGQETSSLSEPKINCKCSRKHWELKQSKNFEADGDSVIIANRPDVSLHCNLNGNYEMLQCDKGLCWCMNEETGKPMSKIVPENLLKLLPCYDRLNFHGKIGSKYLRKCDSRLVGIERTAQKLRERGISWQINKVTCDLAGGFDRTLCDDTRGICNCVSTAKRNSPTAFANDGGAPASTCSCTRDYLDGLTGTLHCDGFGNYPKFKSLVGPQGKVEFCADSRDGWRVSGEVDSTEDITPCCLDTEAYPKPSWPVTPEMYRPSYNCRPFSTVGCDNSPECLKDLSSCNNF